MDLDTLSVDTLRWQGVDLGSPPPQYRAIIRQLKRYADACFYISDREALFRETRDQRLKLHTTLENIFQKTPEFASKLGLDPGAKFEVQELRRAIRIGPDGQHMPQIVVALTQSRSIEVNRSTEAHTFRGGSTIIVDLSKPAVQYAIVKRIDSKTREQRTAAFIAEASSDPVRKLLIAPDRLEPFAALHSLTRLG